MKHKMIFWQFFGAHVVILAAAIVVLAGYTRHVSRVTFERQWLHELDQQASLLAAVLPKDGAAVDERGVARFFEGIGDTEARHRFTVVLPDGRVLGDTDADAARLPSHSDRPEVIAATREGWGMSWRHSASIGKRMLYLARRVPQEGPLQAVVRVSIPERRLTDQLRASDRVLLVLPLGILVLTLVLSVAAAYRVVGPVADLQRGLARIGGGDLGHRLALPRVPHLADLARAINHMADRLQADIRALGDERNLRTLILANLAHGVIALDSETVILDLNAAARRMLRIDPAVAPGTRFVQVIRNPELLALVEACARGEGQAEKEIAGGGPGETRLHVRASALNDPSGRRVGTLLTVVDVTVLRRLETVRQDFVANVSHELRTPVTAVKGFAEALLDGALRDPVRAERFAGIIARQANQLESIIRDLLDLSRLENRAAQAIERRPTPLREVVEHAVELCQARAEARGVILAAACPGDLRAPLHAGLVEQALVNLIDNAIAYETGGGAASRVEIEAAAEGPSVRITVRDHGAGIERRHLDRLFERFYRIDKGRSREQGGTGLGLAIVKHIALIHKGTVDVESAPGAGASFTIRLPA